MNSDFGDRVRIFRFRDSIMITKDEESDFFASSSTAFAIPIFNLSAVLKFLLIKKLLSPKVLEGVLEEFYDYTRD